LTQPLRIADDAWPLILITTNEERDLPPAFLRRCVVLSHDLPEDAAYVDYLMEHGRAHFRQETDSAPLDEGLMRAAAEQLRSDRRHTLAAHLPPPGLAEYLDLLRALQDLAPGNLPRQQAMFATLNRYTYLKHRVEDDKASAIRQQRPNLAKDQPAS
jgi:MoxR-like ATPase